MTYFFETYGCQMNSAESAALEQALRERGWKKAVDGEGADAVFLNTCSVRETAETRLRGRLAHYGALKKKRPRPFTLIVLGCMASRLGESFKTEFPALDRVMGTSEYGDFPALLEALEKKAAIPPDTEQPGGNCAERTAAEVRRLTRQSPAFSFASSHLEEGAFRSFVPIMHGCDNFCSYCIVPYVRGREVSRSPVSIRDEIVHLAGKGVREITLLGQNVNSYRYEEPEAEKTAEEKIATVTASQAVVTAQISLDFPGLLRLVAGWVQGTPIERVRFLSANPKDFSAETAAVMAEHSCFCRHLHLPVQHGSNRILAAMNRRYTREDYFSLVEELRRALPGLSLSTDILIGFPGETEEDLDETLRLMDEVHFLYAYMYHYNPREGSAAFVLPGRISEEVKRERLSRVIALQKKHTGALLRQRLGKRERLLIEGISRKNADEVIGRTERDEMAVLRGGPELTGTFVEAALHSLKGNTFRAVPIDKPYEIRRKELICPGV